VESCSQSSVGSSSMCNHSRRKSTVSWRMIPQASVVGGITATIVSAMTGTTAALVALHARTCVACLELSRAALTAAICDRADSSNLRLCPHACVDYRDIARPHTIPCQPRTAANRMSPQAPVQAPLQSPIQAHFQARFQGPFQAASILVATQGWTSGLPHIAPMPITPLKSLHPR
jgi:hypothetical protein